MFPCEANYYSLRVVTTLSVVLMTFIIDTLTLSPSIYVTHLSAVALSWSKLLFIELVNAHSIMIFFLEMQIKLIFILL